MIKVWYLKGDLDQNDATPVQILNFFSREFTKIRYICNKLVTYPDGHTLSL